MSLNQSFNIALNSMQNNQYALTVVAQNIANLHVDGYHRQRVDFVTNNYLTNSQNVLATIRGMNGASISSLTGYIDEGAFNDILEQNSDAQYYNTLANALTGLEDITDDLGDNGLNSLLNDFYKAVTNLEQFPTDISMRQQYLSAAQNVCDKFNDISKKYDSLISDNMQTVSDNTQIINRLLSDLADANNAHVTNNLGSSTQNKIDDILSQLSNYIDVTTDKNPNGTYNLYLGDTKIVEGSEVKYTFENSFNPSSPDGQVVTFSLQSTEDETRKITTGVNDSIKAGSMKAYIEFLNGTNNTFNSVTKMKSALDSAANAFATELNNIQTYDKDGVFAASLTTDDTGLILDRNSKEPIFITTDGTNDINASNIKINDKMFDNPYLIAAARIDEKNFKDESGNLDPNWNKAIGNSDNATEMMALQNKKICSTTGSGNDLTLSQFLINSAAKTGLDASNIAGKADVHQDLLDSAMENYNNLIGVNLDEELADMIRYQRAYEASAKVFTTVNNLIDVVLNMV